eukprot:gene21719-28739_t
MEDSANGYQPLSQASEGIEVEAPSVQEPGSSGDAKPHNEFHGTWEWKVDNFTTATDNKYSDKFEIGTYIWRILMWPRGIEERSPDLAVFLDASLAQYTPLRMCPKAVFTFTLVNHLDPDSNFNKEMAALHTFTPTKSDWGFVSFHSLDAILNPRNGFLDGDSITIRVEIQVQKDEPFAYDSRKETGHADKAAAAGREAAAPREATAAGEAAALAARAESSVLSMSSNPNILVPLLELLTPPH